MPRVAAVALALLVALLLGAGPVAAAGEADPPADPTAPTTVVGGQVPVNDIVPKPNSGVAPRSTGDRGGAAQLAVLAAICVGVGFIATKVVRDARRARPEQHPVPTEGQAPPGPV